MCRCRYPIACDLGRHPWSHGGSEVAFAAKESGAAGEAKIPGATWVGVVVVAMTTQLSLPLAPKPTPKPARVPFVPRVRQVDFPFVPGPECEPRSLDAIPEWLRFWIDEDGPAV